MDIIKELRLYLDGTKSTKEYFKHLEQIIVKMYGAVENEPTEKLEPTLEHYNRKVYTEYTAKDFKKSSMNKLDKIIKEVTNE